MSGMGGNGKTVWIDLDNSPHVLFFDPIIKELKENGINVYVTARNYAQVLQLAKLFNIDYIKVGNYFGKNKFLKALGVITRSLEMVPIAIRKKPVLALSHGSRSQVFAAKLLGIKSAMAYDYEFARGIPFFKPNYKILPDVIPDCKIRNNAEKIIKYPGIKENVYIHKFIPDPEIITKLKLDTEKIIITIRPPAYSAHYYMERSRHLFNETINHLSNQQDTQIILTPRTDVQKNEIVTTWKSYIESGKIIIPGFVVNGLNLIWHSDLVISGGGTMIREAAALNVPAYSIFGSEIGSVDKYLAEAGRLTLIESNEDVIEKIKILKRKACKETICQSKHTLNFIVNEIMKLLGMTKYRTTEINEEKTFVNIM